MAIQDISLSLWSYKLNIFRFHSKSNINCNVIMVSENHKLTKEPESMTSKTSHLVRLSQKSQTHLIIYTHTHTALAVYNSYLLSDFNLRAGSGVQRSLGNERAVKWRVFKLWVVCESLPSTSESKSLVVQLSRKRERERKSFEQDGLGNTARIKEVDFVTNIFVQSRHYSSLTTTLSITTPNKVCVYNVKSLINDLWH